MGLRRSRGRLGKYLWVIDTKARIHAIARCQPFTGTMAPMTLRGTSLTRALPVFRPRGPRLVDRGFDPDRIQISLGPDRVTLIPCPLRRRGSLPSEPNRARGELTHGRGIHACHPRAAASNRTPHWSAVAGSTHGRRSRLVQRIRVGSVSLKALSLEALRGPAVSGLWELLTVVAWPRSGNAHFSRQPTARALSDS
jgi:hypothetical protein